MDISRRSMTRRSAVMLALAGGVLAPLGGKAQQGTPVPQGAGSPDVPVPIGTAVQAGPWRLTVVEALLGAEGTSAIVAASGNNPTPVDGISYVAVHLQAVNTSASQQSIAGEDFSIVGNAGLVRGFLGLVPVSPAIDGDVAPGATADGWIAGAVETDATSVVLLYDGREVLGDWSDARFALTPGATLPVASAPVVDDNEVGTDPAAPAGLNEVISTEDWAVEALEVAWAQDVYNLFPPSDYRTTALGDAAPELVEAWVGFRVRVTCNATDGRIRHLPVTAFLLAEPDGSPTPDLRILSSPYPTVDGGYFGGATREGWILYEVPVGHSGLLVRFLPYEEDRDPRYLSLDGSAGGAVDTGPTAAPATGIAVGSTVVVSEVIVRLRAEASTTADVVAELPSGTVLQVTGDPVDADGYTWYPVTDPASGLSGYVAANFIRPG